MVHPISEPKYSKTFSFKKDKLNVVIKTGFCFNIICMIPQVK